MKNNAQKNNARSQKLQKNGSTGKPGAKQKIQKVNPKGEQIAAAYTRTLKPVALKQRSLPDGSRSLRWKEYVQEIAGSVAFAVTSFPVQPGIPTLFAWLANQALFFQEYEFVSLRFAYETEKGSSTNGKVMLAFQQDVTDAVPVSKQEMLENMYKSSAAPWEPFGLTIPRNSLKALGPWRFIRTATLASNLDQKTYDVGQFLVATQGMADTSNVGELYVEYEVVLRTPLQSSKQLASLQAKLIVGVAPSQSSLFGTTPILTSGLDVTATVNTLTFNRVGNFLIEVAVTGTGLFTSFVPVVSSSTASAAAGAAGVSNAAANVGTAALTSVSAIVTARGQTVVIDCTTISTTITTSITRIAAFTSSFP